MLTFTKGFAKSREVDFYGVVCSDADSNMIKMTEELFLAQLKDLSYIVTDCRSEEFSSNIKNGITPSFKATSSNRIIFYSMISKNSGSREYWSCKIIVSNHTDKNEVIEEKEYDSFYKILMEKKEFLAGIMERFNRHYESAKTASNDLRKIPASTQNIFGNWSGDNYIDKIVILKGGRGFIIFKNGASMNITVNIDPSDHNQIKVIQTSRPNASFFPEMDRKAALDLAPTAKPIEWTFSLIDQKTLKGTKTTVSQNGSYIAVPATWTKKDL